MICPHCSHENEEGIRFCTGCGELLSKRVRGRTAETPATETPKVTQTQAPKNRKGLLLGLAVLIICVLGIKLFSREFSVRRTSRYSASPAIPFSPLPSSPELPGESAKIPVVPKLSPPSPEVNSIEERPVEPQEREKVVEKINILDQELDRLSGLPARREEEFKKFKQDEGWRLLQTIGLDIPFDQLCRKAENAHEKHEWQEVIDQYGKALQTYPQYYDAFFRMANSYNQLNQPDKALEWMLKGLRKFRYNILYEIAAEAYCRKGDETRMLTWLEGALKGGFKASKEDMDRAFSRYKDEPKYLSLLQKYDLK